MSCAFYLPHSHHADQRWPSGEAVVVGACDRSAMPARCQIRHSLPELVGDRVRTVRQTGATSPHNSRLFNRCYRFSAQTQHVVYRCSIAIRSHNRVCGRPPHDVCTYTIHTRCIVLIRRCANDTQPSASTDTTSRSYATGVGSGTESYALHTSCITGSHCTGWGYRITCRQYRGDS